MEKLKCSGLKECTAVITHIDNKGFIYCNHHGQLRASYTPCRKLTNAELQTLLKGQPIKKY